MVTVLISDKRFVVSYELLDAGFKIKTTINDKLETSIDVCWSYLKGLSVYMHNEVHHKNSVSNIEWLLPKDHPQYKVFQWVTGTMSIEEVLENKGLHFKFSQLYSIKFDKNILKAEL